ncbi:NAD-dependent epimerase [Alkalihalobacillus alcalophilus ATCC 27647 = CGMCC 1.3604]|uniref:NAD-dependent epimerase n=1 Tax=Alkalihalobacillus alcalophilus ATCC 27647 = CGMCC 1.3604 TaxID=1218173 RepID=A0A094YS44_ALKAL|nr:NAD-dependent epimerase/dehydratase family protein [Alkalihalobacillus alcalophilus]KGA96282.1 NAD-dependent epimerase [Alkalihalobacillus alcalophilus ATCC 27647 = CGMCC 1.3604]MED1563384.1 NAD-dependent epimerase/dehydratase family protein [Alkalihalobacillus alcalophilus]THG91649.1 NAD-dependent epimerase [Alkalihalobacillus alcalophilus ATCC 27647 = CGMCC 1.3604]
MKKVLVTGINSYIGTSFIKWVSQYPDKYLVDSISLRDEQWKEQSFKDYDVIFHTAAIVHVKENETDQYFKVNRDLTIELAKKAKKEGVKQFIFLSTMGVYGTETGHITINTIPVPKTPYAKSKFEAEQLLEKLGDHNFQIAILRPPIVYGMNCPGNYSRLATLALKAPFFPNINNERSMIYIDNLSEFIRLLIVHEASGLYFPQNKDYVNTTELVKTIAQAHGKILNVTSIFNWAVSIGLKQSETFRKVFGSFVYDKEIAGSPGTLLNSQSIDYETTSFKDTIIRTEGRER